MKAALYVRVSTSYQVDKDSLPVQREDLINYAKYAFNIADYEIFEDAGFSGKDTNRPAFKEMMKRIKQGEFSHLFVWKIDRVSRNLLDFCDMYEDLKKYNCTFVSKNEQFDTGSAMGEAMLKIILVFAELERKLTSERVTSIMLARAEKGLWNGAHVPLGYNYDEKTKYPIINKEEAKSVKLIFDLYLDLQSTTAVARYLNNHAIKTKRGGSWGSKSICDIIHNPFYYGTLRYNYRESARGKLKDEKDWIVKDNNHEAIISKEQWDKCNAIMEENAEKNQSRLRKRVSVQHIFGDILFCGSCGSKMVCSLDRPRKLDGYRPTRYLCNGKMKGSLCKNPIVSDVTIGDFMLNYVLNFMKCLKKQPYTTNELESILLSGEIFKDVKLDENSLYDTIILLQYIRSFDIKSNYNYSDNIIDFQKEKTVRTELDSLQSTKLKLERAAERLTNLYLYDEVEMAAQDYYKKKNEIDDKLKDINKQIQENIDNNMPCNTDINFVDDMKELVLKLNILEGVTIRELTLNGSRAILRDFFNTIIGKVIILDSKVMEIQFKNGLVHKFIYD